MKSKAFSRSVRGSERRGETFGSASNRVSTSRGRLGSTKRSADGACGRRSGAPKVASKVGAVLAALILAPTGAHAGFGEWFEAVAVDRLLHVLTAIGILFGGWLLARLVSNAVFSLLCKTDLDDKLAQKLGIDLLLAGKEDAKKEHAVERFCSRLVFYVMMLFVIIAALDFAGLSAAAGPLSNFLEILTGALPLIGKAVLILVVAYFAGLILRKVTVMALSKTSVDDKISAASDADESAKPFSETAGQMIFWLLMLVGIAGAFEALHIEAVAAPLRNVLDQIVQLLPAIGLAALILVGGFLLGRMLQAVVKNLLHSAGFDGLKKRLRLEQVFAKREPSDVLGLALFFLVMLHALIAALDELGLEALSDPISQIIEQFWALLPTLATSALILFIAVLAGRVVRSVVEGLLQNVGLDRWLGGLGLDFSRFANQDNPEEKKRVDTPSELVGVFVQFAIVLIALIQVLENLALHRWSTMANGLLSFAFGNLLIAIIIAAAGFAVGNWVRSLIKASNADDNPNTTWLAGGARAAIMVFAFTMAIHQLHVAPTFVLLTFGLLFGALCLALALAFGLGSREVAADIVKRQADKARGEADNK